MTRNRIALLLMLAAGAAPSVLADGPNLATKAKVFEEDMAARFLLDGQALCKLRNAPEEGGLPDYEMPDNAYMTGIHTATLSMKYAVTKDPMDREAALRSLEALHRLCSVSGKKGVLARAAWPKDRPTKDNGVWRDSRDGVHRWRGDVSTDQVDGAMFGFFCAHELVADDAQKARIADDVTAMVDLIVENGLRITDVDGKPTAWSKYYPEQVRKREKMNALLWLQACKVAAHVTGDEKYRALYRKYAVDEEYAKIAVESRVCVNPLVREAVNHSDDVLMFLAYTPLLLLENDPGLRGLYLKSLSRSWEGNGKHPGVKPEGNPLFAFTMAKHASDGSGVGQALETLRLFPLTMKLLPDTLAKYAQKHGFEVPAGPASPEPEKGKVVPIDRRDRAWSAWVQDPYFGTNWDPRHGDMEFNGHDYLLAYWLGRYYGMVTGEL